MLLALLVICLSRVSLTDTAPTEDHLSSQPVLDDETTTRQLSTTTRVQARNRRRSTTNRFSDRCSVRVFTRRLSSPNCTTITSRLKGCWGTCSSGAVSSTLKNGVYTSRSHPTMHRRCVCCSPVSTRIGQLTMSCLIDGVSRFRRVAVEVATECNCRPCGSFND